MVSVSLVVKHSGGGIMMWGCFSEKGLGPLIKVDGKMNRLDYIDILKKNYYYLSNPSIINNLMHFKTIILLFI